MSQAHYAKRMSAHDWLGVQLLYGGVGTSRRALLDSVKRAARVNPELIDELIAVAVLTPRQRVAYRAAHEADVELMQLVAVEWQQYQQRLAKVRLHAGAQSV